MTVGLHSLSCKYDDDHDDDDDDDDDGDDYMMIKMMMTIKIIMMMLIQVIQGYHPSMVTVGLHSSSCIYDDDDNH